MLVPSLHSHMYSKRHYTHDSVFLNTPSFLTQDRKKGEVGSLQLYVNTEDPGVLVVR